MAISKNTQQLDVGILCATGFHLFEVVAVERGDGLVVTDRICPNCGFTQTVIEPEDLQAA